MTLRHKTRRDRTLRTTLAISVLAGTALAASTARASFLDQLLGAASQAPVLQGAPVQSESLAEGEGTRAPTSRYVRAVRPDTNADAKPKHKSVAVADRTPKLQKTTSLMADKTLRPGDAIMLAEGVKVYDGPVASIHERRQFVALGAAHHVSRANRDALIAMVPTQRDHDAATSAGRSVTEAVVVSQGYQIQDDRSGTVRYVGP